MRGQLFLQSKFLFFWSPNFCFSSQKLQIRTWLDCTRWLRHYVDSICLPVFLQNMFSLFSDAAKFNLFLFIDQSTSVHETKIIEGVLIFTGLFNSTIIVDTRINWNNSFCFICQFCPWNKNMLWKIQNFFLKSVVFFFKMCY